MADSRKYNICCLAISGKEASFTITQQGLKLFFGEFESVCDQICSLFNNIGVDSRIEGYQNISFSVQTDNSIVVRLKREDNVSDVSISSIDKITEFARECIDTLNGVSEEGSFYWQDV